MSWIKHVVVDLLMVVVIALAALLDITAARWAVIIYTPLMLVLKVVALLGGGLLGQLRQTKEAPPGWFFHAVYAVSIVLLLLGSWWIMAGAWAVIWVLSVLAERRAEVSRRGRAKAR